MTYKLPLNKAVFERYQIDMTASRRKRSGLEGAIYFLPSLINDEWK